MRTVLAFDFIQTEWPYEAVRTRVLDGVALPLDEYARDAVVETLAGLDDLIEDVAPYLDVDAGEPSEAADGIAVRISWRARTAKALFPVMDGDLRIAPFPGGGTYFSFSGVYAPPLGSVGAAINRLGLHRIAAANVRSILQRITRALEPVAVPAASVSAS